MQHLGASLAYRVSHLTERKMCQVHHAGASLAYRISHPQQNEHLPGAPFGCISGLPFLSPPADRARAKMCQVHHAGASLAYRLSPNGTNNCQVLHADASFNNTTHII